TLTATAGTATPVTFTATAIAGAATQLTIHAGDTQAARVGTAVAIPATVIVQDQFGNPVAGLAVTFAVTTGGGTVSPLTAVATDSNGIATVTSWTLGTTAGSNTLTASIGTGSPVTFTATATAGAATQLTIHAGDTQAATVGTAIATPPAVLVRDQFDNPTAGVPVLFAVASGGGTVNPATAVSTDANGIAII